MHNSFVTLELLYLKQKLQTYWLVKRQSDSVYRVPSFAYLFSKAKSNLQSDDTGQWLTSTIV